MLLQTPIYPPMLDVAANFAIQQHEMELTRGADGRWRARLERGDRWAELWAGEGLDWIQVFTGNDRRDLSIALEPMTCGPNAFNPGPTHDGMITLPPGGSVSCVWGIDGA